MSRTLICAIQIGTSRICAAAAYRDQNGNYEITAIETEQTAGSVKNGYIVDPATVAAHIKSLVLKLSNRVKSADCQGIGAVYVGVNSIAMHSIANHPEIMLEEGKQVTAEITSLLKQQSAETDVTGYEVVGVETIGYTLDGVDCINPLGHTGNQLVAHHQLIVAPNRLCEQVRAVIAEAELELMGIIATPLSVSQVLTPDEKQRGCALVDIGYSLTTVSVYANGALQYLATIPLGGNSVTADLAKANMISPEEAEKMKISKDSLDIVCQCRYEELAANILHQIGLSGYKDKLAAGCIVTGGSSLQRGLTSLLSECLGMTRVIARGFSGICFGLSDRKPQFAALTTMISYCTANCEVKPVEPEPEPVGIEDPKEKITESKPVDTEKEKPATTNAGKATFGRFFKDLFSGIDE